MALKFLTDDHLERYRHFSADPTPEQLGRYSTLEPHDLEFLLITARDQHLRLGLAVQLCTLRFLGTFLTNPTDVPENVVQTTAHLRHTDIARVLRGVSSVSSSPLRKSAVNGIPGSSDGAPGCKTLRSTRTHPPASRCGFPLPYPAPVRSSASQKSSPSAHYPNIPPCGSCSAPPRVARGLAGTPRWHTVPPVLGKTAPHGACPLVRVVQHPCVGPSTRLRHLERAQHQFRVQRFPHGPAHHHSGEQVKHHRQVEPALTGGQIRDIRGPLLIGRGRREVPLEHVRSHRMTVLGLGGAAKLALAAHLQPRCLHQPMDSRPTDPHSLGLEFSLHSRRTVGGSTLGMNGLDGLGQDLILLMVCTPASRAPRRVTALADFEYPTHHRHRKARSVRVDEGVDQRLSLAKNPTAFFKMSRS